MRLSFSIPSHGGFCESLPDGFYAYDGIGGIVTPEWGEASSIGQRALYLCIADNHAVAVCGGSDDTAYLMPRHGGMWQNKGKIWGPRPILFNNSDQLSIIDSAETAKAIGAGSQGYRFIEYGPGKFYFADETKFDPVLRICEWIRRDNITAGQAVTDELIAYNDRTRKTHLIERGTWRHIKFRRSGDNLAFAGVRHDTLKAVFNWLTVDELNSLPEFREGEPDGS